MNLVDELMKADTKKAEEVATKDIPSERMARILGLNEPVMITIKEVLPRKMKSIQSMMFKKNGSFDMEKSLDANALLVVEGLINPDLKVKDLQEKYGCGTPKDLALKLFRNETQEIADEILQLSGVKTDDQEVEEEIKN